MHEKYFIYVDESDSFTHKSILDIKDESEKRKKKANKKSEADKNTAEIRKG